jgi:protein arginine kinase activator
MLCQRCHKNLASVRYAEVVDGKVTDLHLCQECLSRQQADVAAGFELAGSAPTPKRKPPLGSRLFSDTPDARVVCRGCGLGLHHALATGRVGCGVCYESFGVQLEAAVRGLQGALHHRGRSPRADDSRDRIRADLQTKRALLRSALKAENYEEAAILRDTIRTLEAQLGNSLKELRPSMQDHN